MMKPMKPVHRHLFVVGAGDMTARLTNLMAATGTVSHVTVVGPSASCEVVAAALASSFDISARAERFDARDVSSMVDAIRRASPDVILQTGALMSPWALAGRTDPLALGLATAGLAVRMPLQMPVLRATMMAVHEVGFAGPVANLSLPDLNHPLLATEGLAPTLGLGNVAMCLLRARAALRAEHLATRESEQDHELPLIRVVGQHNHVFDTFQSRTRSDPDSGPWTWVANTRRDDLSFSGTPVAPGPVYNAITAASALPVLQSLMPGGDPLRWSTPSPLGLLGGFPIHIDEGRVTLDLPDGVTVDACVEMCRVEAREDGFEHIDGDGYVHFSDRAHNALGNIAPELLEPLCLADVDRRADRLLELLR
jgi:hypothetical protein